MRTLYELLYERQLLIMCLEGKWKEGMTLKDLLLDCAFCQHNIKYQDNDCGKCWCPKGLCQDEGKEGFYRQIANTLDWNLSGRVYHGCWQADYLHARSFLTERLKVVERLLTEFY